jgi:OPA family glycerol-3-phosphate transporter-like MFS transporter
MTVAARIAAEAHVSRRLARHQAATIALLFLGYAGYYFCRADLSVGLPLILDELRARGADPGAARIAMGAVASFGVLAYAIGKLTLAGIADFTGGKRSFTGGMIGAIAFTLLFAMGGAVPLFTLAWIGNRLVQSTGWAGLVKVASRWFDFRSYGSVMGVLSMSFLVGDMAARQILGGMIAAGAGWRALFVLAAGFVAVMLVLNVLFLRESRAELGFDEPNVNPVNVFGAGGAPTACADDGAAARTAARTAARRGRLDHLRAVLGPLARSPQFWLVCALSLGTTLVRETFNTWTPTYFSESAGMSEARAAFWSSVFPGIGAVSVLLTGWLSDRFGPSGRAIVMLAGLLVATAALSALAGVPAGASVAAAVGLTGVVAMGLIGPYSYLAGAIAMDFGGARGSAVASGVIDGIGYLGGVLAGDAMARVSVAFGWQGAFGVLAVVCMGAAAGSAALWRSQRRSLHHAT